eukprot:PhM_4_TR340/c0_g1_i1/m.9058
MLGLRYACDWRPLLWEVIYFSLTIYMWRNWYEMSWLLERLPLLFITSMFAFCGGTIMHNIIHVPMFHSKRLNSLFHIAVTNTYGWPVTAMIPGHNLSHHKYTSGPKDAMRARRMNYKNNLVNYLMFPIATVRSVAGSDFEYMMDQRKKGTEIWDQYLLEVVTFFPVQIALLYCCPTKYFWTVFIPQLYAKWQLIAVNILQHDGCPTPAEHAYNHSRNFVGWVTNFFTFNNGYHSIHHNHPGWHWSRLKEAHERLVVPNIHPNLLEPNIFLYTFRAVIYPAVRKNFDGTLYTPPPQLPDEPWYDGKTTETYSNVADDENVTLPDYCRPMAEKEPKKVQ